MLPQTQASLGESDVPPEKRENVGEVEFIAVMPSGPPDTERLAGSVRTEPTLSTDWKPASQPLPSCLKADGAASHC